MKKIKVTQKENEPEIVVEVTAQAIQEISSAMKKLRSGRLKDKTIALLVKAACPQWVQLTSVREVLFALENLEKEYLK